jgi:hypothetical protein
MWVVQNSEFVTTEKLGDEGLKGMSTPLYLPIVVLLTSSFDGGMVGLMV